VSRPACELLTPGDSVDVDNLAASWEQRS